MKRTGIVVWLGFSAAFLAACGSGSNGSTVTSSTSSAIPTPGTTTTTPTASTFSWSGSPRNQSVAVSGIAQTIGFSVDTSGRVTTGSPTSGEASYTSTYNDSTNNNSATAASVMAGGTEVSFPTSAGNPALAGLGSVDEFGGENDSNGMVTANPYDAGWDYQTFGTWHSAGNTNLAGSFSVGRQTDGSAIPATGTATYNGFASGFAIIDGAVFDVVSSASAQANFASRSINFSTTGTQTRADGSTFTSNTSLDMSGALSYQASTNQITGTLSTTGGLSGPAQARFYGPAAQEIGGTFALGSGTNAYLGGFGGKR